MTSNLTCKQKTRNYFRRFVLQKPRPGRTQEYPERLSQALNVFRLRSNITLYERVTKIAEKQEDLCRELEERGEYPGANQMPAQTRAQATPVPLAPSGVPGFSDIHSTHGTFTAIAGNQTISAVTNNNNNTNSGNVVTITTTDSSYDS